MDLLQEMFYSQATLQVKRGYNFDEMSPEELESYIREIVLALTNELHEALGEISWKTWTTTHFFNRDPFVKELIDAWHLLMNLFLAARVSPEEMYQRYTEKAGINHKRIDSGNYQGRNPRCSYCGSEIEIDLKPLGIVLISKPDGTEYWCSDEHYDLWQRDHTAVMRALR